MSAAPLDVLVVGGGIGGLCLANGLVRSGISVAVYERDESAQFRNQGYRIGLKESGARALRDCLPNHLFDLCVATSIRQATRMIFMDDQLRPKFAKTIPPVEPGLAGFGVNRLTLREILLAGLDGPVHFGKLFRCYENIGDSRVRALFADGTSATADLLVGADGTNSAVRQQLIPEAVVDELHWAVYGRTPIGAETLDWMPDVLLDSFNRVIGPGEAAMAVATCRTREPVRQASARLASGALLTDIPDYFSWTMPLLDLRFRDADPATLHQLASETVAGWHPAVGRLVGEADVSATFPVCITSSRPVPRWQASNITLLGDAIHTMSPGRGDGANIALKDARLLCGTLVEVASQRVTLAAAKAHYETEMLHYAFRAVADSLNKPFAPAVPSRR